MACRKARKKRNGYSSNLKKNMKEFHVLGVELLQFKKKCTLVGTVP